MADVTGRGVQVGATGFWGSHKGLVVDVSAENDTFRVSMVDAQHLRAYTFEALQQ